MLTSAKMSSDKNKNADRLFWLIFAAYAASYVGRKTYGTCMSDICTQLAVSKKFAGAISTGYLACYGAGQLASGMVADRVSPQAMIFTGLAGAGICNVLMGCAGSQTLLLVFWCLNGCFQSMLWASTVRAMAQWLPKERRGFAGTAISVSLPAGTVLSYLISSVCLKLAGWREAFVFSGLAALAGAFAWITGCRRKKAFIEEMTLENSRRPVQTKTSEAENAPDSSAAKADTAARADSGSFSLFYCIFGCGLSFTILGLFCNGILKDGITDWIPSFLSEILGADTSMAAFFMSLLPVINISGSIIGRRINEKYTHNEMTTSALMFAAATLCSVLLMVISRGALAGNAPQPGSLKALILMLSSVILFAITTSAMLGANNMFLTFIPLHFASVGRSASVTGFLNSSAYLAAAVSGVVSGSILQNTGWKALMFFWLAIAAAGVPVCMFGAKLWAKGREKLED